MLLQFYPLYSPYGWHFVLLVVIVDDIVLFDTIFHCCYFCSCLSCFWSFIGVAILYMLLAMLFVAIAINVQVVIHFALFTVCLLFFVPVLLVFSHVAVAIVVAVATLSFFVVVSSNFSLLRFFCFYIIIVAIFPINNVLTIFLVFMSALLFQFVFPTHCDYTCWYCLFWRMLYRPLLAYPLNSADNHAIKYRQLLFAWFSLWDLPCDLSYLHSYGL